MNRFVAVLWPLLLCGCAGPYEDLAKDFAAEGRATGKPIEVSHVVLVSNKHRGAFSYNGILSVSLTQDTVEVRPRFPASLYERSVDLKAKDVYGCSMTCFGAKAKNVDLLFSTHGAEITFDSAPELIDWCWRNDLPMVSGATERDWLYSGKALPDETNYRQVSRQEYERQAHSACLGY